MKLGWLAAGPSCFKPNSDGQSGPHNERALVYTLSPSPSIILLDYWILFLFVYGFLASHFNVNVDRTLHPSPAQPSIRQLTFTLFTCFFALSWSTNKRIKYRHHLTLPTAYLCLQYYCEDHYKYISQPRLRSHTHTHTHTSGTGDFFISHIDSAEFP